MPHTAVISFGLTEFQPTRITLVLADRSVKIPEGIIEDVPIMINRCHIPTDFLVLKYRHEPKDPLILGRPFVATAGAIINVKEGRICLNVRNLLMTFDMEKMIKRPLIDNQIFFVDHVAGLAEKSFSGISSYDPLKKSLTASVDDILITENKVIEYARLLDACGEIMSIDAEENDSTKINVNIFTTHCRSAAASVG